MARPRPNEVEDTRAELPSLLADAEHGNTTVITRNGRAIAAVVPWHAVRAAKQSSLLPLAGSGKGYWNQNEGNSLRSMRDEWER